MMVGVALRVLITVMCAWMVPHARVAPKATNSQMIKGVLKSCLG